MVAVAGTYQNGYVKLEQEYPSQKPVRVIVTFLEEIETTPEKNLTFTDFSFAKSRAALEDYKGSFSNTVAEERRADL